MITRGLTKEAEAILNGVNKFGCADFAQLEYFYDNTKKNSASGNPYHVSIANHLTYTKQLNRDGNTLCSKITRRRDYKMIDSIWAALYLLAQDEDNEYTAAEKLTGEINCFRCKGFCTIQMLLRLNGEATWAKIIPCYDSNDVMAVLAEQENYEILVSELKGKHNLPTQFYVVTRNREAIMELSKCNLTIPVQILFLEGEDGEKPTIKVGRKSKDE